MSVHLKRVGARILAEANDLKRTVPALANELGLDLDLVTTVVEGRGDVDSARKVVDLMVASYPIRLADLWIEPDDTDEGVRIMRAEESAATSRVFERKTAKGTLEPFYEYRDSASNGPRGARASPTHLRGGQQEIRSRIARVL